MIIIFMHISESLAMSLSLHWRNQSSELSSISMIRELAAKLRASHEAEDHMLSCSFEPSTAQVGCGGGKSDG